jgi:Ras homolog gene family, member U
MDLRSDLKTLLYLDEHKLKPVMEKEARARAQQMHACTYIECSSLTEKNLKAVFDTAVLTAIEFRDVNALSPTSILPLIEQQNQTTTSKQRTHATKTWRKLVTNCIGI